MKTDKRAGKLSGAINAMIRAKPLIGIIINLEFLSLRLGRISIFQFAQATQTKAQDHLWDRVAIRLYKAWAMNLRRGRKNLPATSTYGNRQCVKKEFGFVSSI